MAMVSLALVLGGCNSESDSHAKTEQVHTQKSNQQHTYSVSKKQKAQLKKEVMQYFKQHSSTKTPAFTTRFFAGGSISTGDWYAVTPEGQLQVSDRGKPGAKAFKKHNIVGITTYTSKDGQQGLDPQAKSLSNIEGYTRVAKMDHPIKKYLFADDGKVYEAEFSGEDTTLSTGFAPKDHNDKDPNLAPSEVFKPTSDKQLADFWKKRLEEAD
ncbi:hypothetical protein CD039_09265 [Staphylococcus argensis]|uniref:Uncharacterized protein n=2 Tax=Staphylococcus argensis TaxID=1607738 RepID=A0A2K4FBA1_9STAP|nr:hypothetical protein [Staphylococcus argensis]POA08648.1 hypothetical protein CD039_09265 [Staphylococcus argensis]